MRARSRLSMSRRGRRSPRWWSATTAFGGCWCMGFHSEGTGKETTPAPNRKRKQHRVRAGTAHAALAFDGDDWVGRCQFGPPDEVPRDRDRAAYDKGQTTLPDWRIACCCVGKGHRHQGVAAD